MGLNDQARADAQEEASTEEALADGEDTSSSNAEGSELSDEQLPDDIESYQAMVEQIASGKPAPSEASENSESESETSESSQEESGSEEGGEQDEEQEPESDEGDESEQGGDDDDDRQEKSDPNRFRVRVDGRPEVDRRALELYQRNRDLSMAEALDRAKKELGQDDQSGDEDGEESEDGENLPQTVADTDAKIAELRKERNRLAREELEFDKAEEMDEEITKLLDHKADLKVRETTKTQEKQSQEQAKFREDFTNSQHKAAELYDFVAKRGPEVERMEEIDRIWKETDDPRYTDPNKPLRLAQIVAGEFNIAPKGKQAKKPETPSGGRPPRKTSPVQPASATSSTAPNSKKGQLEEEIEKLNDPLAYEEFVARFTGQ